MRRVYHEHIPKKFKRRVVHIGRRVAFNLERLINRELPSSVNVETNSACNRTCYYCPRPSERTELEEGLFYSVVDQLKDWGFRGRFTPVGYNEPLTDKRIFRFISYARQASPHFHIMLVTNGDFLDERVMDSLIQAGVDEVLVTIHNPSKTDKINELNILRSMYHNMILQDLREGHRVSPLNNKGGLVTLERSEPVPACYAIDTLNIRADGSVVLCCQDSMKQNVFGNIKNSPIREIWKDTAFVRIRNGTAKGVYELGICQRCEYEI
ncbi:MAG: radical SAM protein [Nanoarchaeota archaeon]